jgi:hypothetical protein
MEMEKAWRHGAAAARTGVLLLAAILCGVLGSPARAGAETDTRSPRWHLFFGVDGAEQSTFGHGGMVWAPFGDLDHSGWRLRAGANGGTFRYLAGSTEITGKLLAAEILPGFQWIGRDIGVTGYAGPTIQDQSTDPYDPGKPRQGTRFGAKALVEGWVRAGDAVIFNASASYATAAETYCVRLAATIDITTRLSLEPEVSAFGEPDYDQQRYGLQIGYRPSRSVQIKVGGGWAIEPDDDGPYAAVQVKIWK